MSKSTDAEKYTSVSDNCITCGSGTADGFNLKPPNNFTTKYTLNICKNCIMKSANYGLNIYYKTLPYEIFCLKCKVHKKACICDTKQVLNNIQE